MKSFAIINVSTGSQQASEFLMSVDDTEQMGSKEKFWCKRSGTDERYLLKFPRPNTGEDWAEKIAAELAGNGGLRLPHASVELATFQGRAAVLIRDFLGDGERLIHGNDLLLERDPSYPHEAIGRVRRHTLTNVFDTLQDRGIEVPLELDLPDGVRTAVDLYSGYLVLDALIGNTDRHHENWGIVTARRTDGTRVLTIAPTYDHGSSLGRELRDEERSRRMTTKDPRSGLPVYAERARSAFFGSTDEPSPLGTFDLLRLVAQRCPSAVRAWIARLEEAHHVAPFKALVGRIPSERISNQARDFATLLLEYNFNRICEAGARP